MAKVTDLDVERFFKILGVKEAEGKGKSANLYQILGCLPETDENGNRLKTPYELLGVPPQFRDGKEVPIVFAIKNRAKKIGKYSGEITEFFYSKINKLRKAQEEEDTIEALKKQYKHAEFMGNIDEAMSIVEVINSLSGGRAEEIMGSYYNYAKFYKKMKKQLLMDMFSHFFLTYIQRYKTQLREGLIKTDVTYRPYFEKTFTVEQNDFNNIVKDINFGKADYGEIQTITVNTSFEDVSLPTFTGQPAPAESEPHFETPVAVPTTEVQQSPENTTSKVSEEISESVIDAPEETLAELLEEEGLLRDKKVKDDEPEEVSSKNTKSKNKLEQENILESR